MSCWFTSMVTAKASAGPAEARNQKLPVGFMHGWAISAASPRPVGDFWGDHKSPVPETDICIVESVLSAGLAN